jgi:hypothetical protein
MIVFGKNKYLLRSFKPSEFGLPTDPNDTDLIVVYQRYAHLYFIPLFSLGKVWALKRGDALFELTPEFHQFINAVNPKLPSGWMAYSWFWLGILGLCIFQVSTCSSEKRQVQERKEYAVQQKSTLQNRFDLLQVDDFVRFKVTADPKTGESHTFGRVKAIMGDSLALEMASLEPIKEGYKMTEPANMMKYLIDFPDGQVINVSKSVLRAACCGDADEQCPGFPLHVSTKKLFWIKEISHPVALEFEVGGLYMSQKKAEVGKYITNRGLPVTILQIRSLGQFKYNEAVEPTLVETNRQFIVKGYGNANSILANTGFEFSCRDVKGKIHWFQVSDTSKMAMKIEK